MELSSTSAEAPRRFPEPWRVDQIPGGYVVRDANRQALAYLYSRDNWEGWWRLRAARDLHQVRRGRRRRPTELEGAREKSTSA
jgi:hypothetical protein